MSKIENMKVLETFYKNNKLVRAASPEESKFFSLTNLGSLMKYYNNLFESELNVITLLFRSS